jgi:hypothetical protein
LRGRSGDVGAPFKARQDRLKLARTGAQLARGSRQSAACPARRVRVVVTDYFDELPFHRRLAANGTVIRHVDRRTWHPWAAGRVVSRLAV